MDDPDDLTPISRTPAYRPLVFVAVLIVGLLLLVLGGLTLISASTRATNTLVHRGDCRSQHQGDYFAHLSELVVEATKADSDRSRLEDLAQQLKTDARLYKACVHTQSDTGPSTLPTPPSLTATTSTTRKP